MSKEHNVIVIGRFSFLSMGSGRIWATIWDGHDEGEGMEIPEGSQTEKNLVSAIESFWKENM